MDLNPYAPPADLEPMAAAPSVPQTLSEILARSISLYVQNAPIMLGVIFSVWIPLQLVLGYFAFFVFGPEDPRPEFGASNTLENLVTLLPIGGITAITHRILSGGKPSVWHGLTAAVAAWPRLLGTRIVATVLMLLALVAFIIPGIYVGTRSALADQAAVLERANPFRSMKRSFELTQGAFWRYFFLLAIYLLQVVVAGMLLGIPTIFYPEIDLWLYEAIQSLVVYLIVGWITVALTVAYWATLEEDRMLNSHLEDQAEPPA